MNERNTLSASLRQKVRSLLALRTAGPSLRKFSVQAMVACTALAVTASALAIDPETHRPTERATAVSKVRRWLETGEASWYGLKFQGRKTATGERFDMNSLTCAHRSLPLGSWIRVTNLQNRKSIFVRVNDRGPYFGDRIVDLSFAAARAVGLTTQGTGQVKLETVQPGDPEIARALVAQMHMPESSATSGLN